MMAAAPIQQNGTHTGVPIDLDPPDSRKRPLEAPPEAGSTKRTNTGGGYLLRCLPPPDPPTSPLPSLPACLPLAPPTIPVSLTLSFIKMASLFGIHRAFDLMPTQGLRGRDPAAGRQACGALSAQLAPINGSRLEGDKRTLFPLHPSGHKLRFSLALRFPLPWPRCYCQPVHGVVWLRGARAGYCGGSRLCRGDSGAISPPCPGEMSYNGTGVSSARLHQSRHNNAPRQR